MRRSTFCRYFPMSIASATGLVSNHAVEHERLAGNRARSTLAESSDALNEPQRHQYRWGVLYWMPYDNNLSQFGESIMAMLSRGTRDSDVVVAVQSDYQGDRSMRRRYIVDGVMTAIPADTWRYWQANGGSIEDNFSKENRPEDVSMGTFPDEDSSDSNALADYLAWASQTFSAEHWAVIVVGHGGQINPISPDDHRVIDTHSRTWMGIDHFADVVNQFNQSVGGQVDLLFFQNCNKATLEVLYEAKDCARYTLASQFALGAPNFYYEDWLTQLGTEDDASFTNGYDAALAIMNAEDPSMYQTLTLVDNQAIAQLPTYLAPLLKTLEHGSTAINVLDLPTYRYFGERHCDVMALLERLVEANGQGKTELQAFSTFVISSIISHCATEGHLYGSGALMRSQPDQFCGIGMFCPMSDAERSRYGSMALAQDIDMASLYDSIA